MVPRFWELCYHISKGSLSQVIKYPWHFNKFFIFVHFRPSHTVFTSFDKCLISFYLIVRSIKQRVATIMKTTCASNVSVRNWCTFVSTVKLRFRYFISLDCYRVSFVIRFLDARCFWWQFTRAFLEAFLPLSRGAAKEFFAVLFFS